MNKEKIIVEFQNAITSTIKAISLQKISKNVRLSFLETQADLIQIK